MRSAQTSFGSPIETQTSVWTKSTSRTPSATSSVSVTRAAVLDAVVEAAEHARGVLGRLLVAHLRADRVEVGRARPLVGRGDLEGAARAGRGLGEEQGDVLAGEASLLAALPLGGLELGGEVEQRPELVGRQVGLLEQVPAVECGERHGGIVSGGSPCGNRVSVGPAAAPEPEPPAGALEETPGQERDLDPRTVADA